MPVAVFGTAQFADVPRDAPQHLLQVAWDAGFRRFDTAPCTPSGRPRRSSAGSSPAGTTCRA
ncbi:hypothetical protein ACFQX8_19000 [Klenkia terrae]|uniref:hypothetical protein n=1 Tax=Klenkia terrae TaxID=1052259 RepID=UPI00361823B9